MSYIRKYAHAVQVPDDAFGAGWNDSLEVPTKNAIYDKLATTGTVTSVAMTVPAILSVTGSPITMAGTLAVSLANQSANNVFAGPASGGAAAPSFRALVANDIPALDAAKIASGLLATARLVSSAGANQALYLNGSSVVTSSPRFLFDGTDMSLVNPTAATVGSQTQNSPYFVLEGSKWRTDTSASGTQRARISMQPAATNHSTIYAPNLAVDFYSIWGTPSWQSSFSYGTLATDYLVTRIRLGNPVYSGWGGILDVTYDGAFTFRKLDGTHGLLSAEQFVGTNTSYPFLVYYNGYYSPEIRSHFGGKILLASGRPFWKYGDNAGNSGTEYVQSDLPISIGVGGAGAAMLQVRRTTEQFRLEYNASNYYKTTVGSAGSVTFDAVGSGAKFIFSDKVVARLEKRVNTYSDTNKITPDIDLYDAEIITAQAQSLIIDDPLGSALPFEELIISIASDGLGSDSISFGAAYIGGGVHALPATTLPGGQTLHMGFKYNSALAYWALVTYQEY